MDGSGQSLIESLGFKQFKCDKIVLNPVTIPPKLIFEMNNWRDSYRSIFETLMMVTNEGQYGIRITGPELHSLTGISNPAVFIAIGFLSKEGWVIKEKDNTAGNPNIYFINVDKVKEFAGEAEV